MNVTVHAAETSSERLVGEYLPLLLEATAEVSTSWSNLAMLPTTSPRVTGQGVASQRVTGPPRRS
jgi:IclR family pca regulon transcriptional regulator